MSVAPLPHSTAALRQALRAAISPDDVTAIAEVLREMALDGNLSAIRLLLSYVVGRPGADDKDEAEPAAAPAEPPAAEGPASVGAAAAPPRAEWPVAPPTPGKDPAPAPAAAAGPPTPAPLPSPSLTVSNGPATRPPPSPPPKCEDRTPMCARRRWPR